MYREALAKCKDLNLGRPELPRQRRTAKRIGDFYRNGAEKDTVWASPEEFYRAQYFAAIGLISEKIKSRFDSGTLNFLCAIEDILLDAANGREFSFSDEFRKENISHDVDVNGLKNEFITLRSFIVESFHHIEEVTSIETIIQIFRSNKFNLMLNLPLLSILMIFCISNP